MSKVTFSIQYAGLTLQIAKNDYGQDVTPLKPIADLFGLEWVRQRKRVSEGNYYPRFFGTCGVLMYSADGQRREQTCILLSRVAAFLSGVNPERVRAAGNLDGADFLIEKQEEWADALHDYEELGVAINLNHHRVQGAKVNALIRAVALRAKTADEADRKLMASLVARLAGEIGLAYQPELPGM
ncbi:MAG: hypothetical protein JSR74_12520 [Proteobacteria bacterium]|nr:hypothetical protein [Pseudomonadota bacterium]